VAASLMISKNTDATNETGNETVKEKPTAAVGF
jgi:hypothetical protein